MGSWINKKQSQQPTMDILGNNWGLRPRAPPAFPKVPSLPSSLPSSPHSSSTDSPSPDTLAHSALPPPWLLHLHWEFHWALPSHFPSTRSMPENWWVLLDLNTCVPLEAVRGQGSWLLCCPWPTHSINCCAIELGKGIQIQILLWWWWWWLLKAKFHILGLLLIIQRWRRHGQDQPGSWQNPASPKLRAPCLFYNN